VLPKFAIVLVFSFGLTLLAYEFAVRRWNAVRFLFGLKPRPRAAVTLVPPPRPAPVATGRSRVTVDRPR
jgi:hypothetical protein